MFDTQSLIQYGGLWIVCLALFLQTGVFFCFFIPSGGLMFTAGVLLANGQMDYPLAIVFLLLTMAALLGNLTGYGFGWKAGPLLYERKDTRWFKKQHLHKAEQFYEKHGGLALAGGLFFPVVRTFSPIVAGMVKMNWKRFLLFTGLGSAAWTGSFVMMGCLVGSVPALEPYLHYIVLGIIILVTLPVVLRVVKAFRKG